LIHFSIEPDNISLKKNETRETGNYFLFLFPFFQGVDHKKLMSQDKTEKNNKKILDFLRFQGIEFS